MDGRRKFIIHKPSRSSRGHSDSERQIGERRGGDVDGWKEGKNYRERERGGGEGMREREESSARDKKRVGRSVDRSAGSEKKEGRGIGFHC